MFIYDTIVRKKRFIKGCDMAEKKEKTNSQRFLDAYNSIDYALKARYNFNRAMGFSDLIRKSVVNNYVVRKYEDDLIDYGRLRNAIIHSSNENFVIAEPHDQVVEHIEHIEKLITAPPRVLDTVGQRDVLVTYAEKSMREVITLMASSNYSNIPIYKGNQLLGVANGQKILNSFGQYMMAGGKADVFLDQVQIEDMLSSLKDSIYYVVKKADCTIEDALNEFNNNHKLLAILFTKNGLPTEMPVGIMTGANFVDAQNVLENY